MTSLGLQMLIQGPTRPLSALTGLHMDHPGLRTDRLDLVTQNPIIWTLAITSYTTLHECTLTSRLWAEPISLLITPALVERANSGRSSSCKRSLWLRLFCKSELWDNSASLAVIQSRSVLDITAVPKIYNNTRWKTCPLHLKTVCICALLTK